ncbi:hypothetical protein EMIHUDRAFT_110803 [Emiliania huxleyi CCMP1516]|uniref:F-box domain-containing protein n=2 Tax=Emiliania huxleyi TaxID=2903 RepID=A0A0D3KHM2_EMIH1|nr:hypothetical protein EMIHUDRAFT_110803 [Emiliania huxleyi CCMP1516]EOD35257.1 hypothetical protein EMIHUDRAFT_110803 [Emiliania huxleyi CCMP1516]|eukprot:XP_005787686.1 hypothetical protein EMIHUDRAFT_110803 [Emiliania huxleyi CCMP1516]
MLASNPGRDLLASLPDELVAHILAALPLRTLSVSSRASRLFARIRARLEADRISCALELQRFPFRDGIRPHTKEGSDAFFRDRSLRDADVKVLAKACACGALATCRELHLSFNSLADGGLAELASSFSWVTMDSLRCLSLYKNAIGDAGTAALGRAVSSGALPALETLLLNNNQVGDEGVAALAAAAAGGKLQLLSKLSLSANRIGDAAREICCRGAFPLCGVEGRRHMSIFLMDNPAKARPVYSAFSWRRSGKGAS